MLELVRLAARMALAAGEPIFSVRSAVDAEVEAYYEEVRIGDEGARWPDPVPLPARAVERIAIDMVALLSEAKEDR